MADGWISCAGCGRRLLVTARDAGLSVRCLYCGAATPVGGATSARGPRLGPGPAAPGGGLLFRRRTGALAAGWLCFALGMLAIFSVILMPFALIFFIAAIVLGIVSVAETGGRGGIGLLLSSLILPPIAAVLAFAFLIGGCVRDARARADRERPAAPAPLRNAGPRASRIGLDNAPPRADGMQFLRVETD